MGKLSSHEYQNYENNTISYNRILQQPPHYHEVYEILFVKAGSSNVRFVVDQVPYSFRENEVFLIPPYTTHFVQCSDADYTCERTMLFLSPAYEKKLLADSQEFQHALNDIEARRKFRLYLPPQKAVWIRHIFSFLEKEPENRIGFEQLHRTYIQLLFFSLIQDLFEERKSSSSSRTDNPMLPVAQYISDHIAEKITLETLAKEFYLSESSISAGFRKSFSVPFREYLTVQRIRLSQKLISEGVELTEIPRRVGFEDYSNFYRSFRKKVGMGPREYRQHILQVDVPSRNAMTRYGLGSL